MELLKIERPGLYHKIFRFNWSAIEPKHQNLIHPTGAANGQKEIHGTMQIGEAQP